MKSVAAAATAKPECNGVDWPGLIGALVNPDGSLTGVGGCTPWLIGLCRPSRPGDVALAVAMVPKALSLSATSLEAFDWLHDANGIRFLASTGSWPVEAAAWRTVKGFAEALFAAEEWSMYRDDPEASRRELIDSLAAQMFGASSLPVADISAADLMDARTELVFLRNLAMDESAELASQVPVGWREMFATDSVENGLDRNPSTLVSLGDNALLDGDLLDDELRLVALDVRPYREALRQSFGEELAGDEMSDAEIREMVFCAWDTLRASFEGGLGIDAAVRRLSMWARVEEAINASDPLKTTLCAFGIHAFICAWWAVSRLVHNPF